MYICPICNQEFKKENDIAKHLLSCWRKYNPYHLSTNSIQTESEDIEIDNGVLNFFQNLSK